MTSEAIRAFDEFVTALAPVVFRVRGKWDYQDVTSNQV